MHRSPHETPLGTKTRELVHECEHGYKSPGWSVIELYEFEIVGGKHDVFLTFKRWNYRDRFTKHNI